MNILALEWLKKESLDKFKLDDPTAARLELKKLLTAAGIIAINPAEIKTFIRGTGPAFKTEDGKSLVLSINACRLSMTGGLFFRFDGNVQMLLPNFFYF